MAAWRGPAGEADAGGEAVTGWRVEKNTRDLMKGTANHQAAVPLPEVVAYLTEHLGQP